MFTPPLGLLGRARLIETPSVRFLQVTCRTQSSTRSRPFLGESRVKPRKILVCWYIWLMHGELLCAELVQAMEGVTCVVGECVPDSPIVCCMPVWVLARRQGVRWNSSVEFSAGFAANGDQRRHGVRRAGFWGARRVYGAVWR
jgi:hypothetical protein